jgi:hypothetical protein
MPTSQEERKYPRYFIFTEMKNTERMCWAEHFIVIPTCRHTEHSVSVAVVELRTLRQRGAVNGSGGALALHAIRFS